jgi:hypothetical protein
MLGPGNGHLDPLSAKNLPQKYQMSSASFGTVNATGLNVTGLLQASQVITTKPMNVSNLVVSGNLSNATLSMSNDTLTINKPVQVPSLTTNGNLSVSNTIFLSNATLSMSNDTLTIDKPVQVPSLTTNGNLSVSNTIFLSNATLSMSNDTLTINKPVQVPSLTTTNDLTVSNHLYSGPRVDMSFTYINVTNPAVRGNDTAGTISFNRVSGQTSTIIVNFITPYTEPPRVVLFAFNGDSSLTPSYLDEIQTTYFRFTVGGNNTTQACRYNYIVIG